MMPSDKHNSNSLAPKKLDAKSRRELEVRLTAQHILTRHLKTSPTNTHPFMPNSSKSFWKNISINLTGAALLDLDLSDCHVSEASFHAAYFYGVTRFDRGTFSGEADFSQSKFKDETSFIDAHFLGSATFEGSRFRRRAAFGSSRFETDATFRRARFGGDAWFGGSVFLGNARFGHARFESLAIFGGSRFARPSAIWAYRF